MSYLAILSRIVANYVRYLRPTSQPKEDLPGHGKIGGCFVNKSDSIQCFSRIVTKIGNNPPILSE